jgi:hypothetical protein
MAANNERGLRPGLLRSKKSGGYKSCEPGEFGRSVNTPANLPFVTPLILTRLSPVSTALDHRQQWVSPSLAFSPASLARRRCVRSALAPQTLPFY